MKSCFFLKAEDGIRVVEGSRGFGDVYTKQRLSLGVSGVNATRPPLWRLGNHDEAATQPQDAHLGCPQRRVQQQFHRFIALTSLIINKLHSSSLPFHLNVIFMN